MTLTCLVKDIATTQLASKDQDFLTISLHRKETMSDIRWNLRDDDVQYQDTMQLYNSCLRKLQGDMTRHITRR